jgi:Ca-activated chloride channel family protein
MTPLPHLANPGWLLLLLALPLLAWLHHRRGALGALTYSRLPAPARERKGARGAPPAGARSRLGALRLRLHLPFYARLAALACLVLALARPQLGYAWEESLTEGIDIAVVLDISGSMAAEDFQPDNRLAVAKAVVKEFVDGRTGDRIAIIVFSGTAMVRAPLTTDHPMLDSLIDAVDINSLPDGTAIGVALANAAARLKASPAKTRVALLVTDGVNNTGEIDPMSAASLCEGLGIRVYTVGVGAAGRVPVPWPMVDPATGQKVMRRVMMDVPVDEVLLKKIAGKTGGRFYKATDRESMQRIFHEIDRLEKTPLQVKRYVRYREAAPPFLWAGLALLLLPLAAAGAQATAEP